RLHPRPALSFSGGEPFLQLELLKELVARAAGFGMASEIVTSAAWVADERRAHAVLADLSQRGLGTLVVSYDRFHEPYVAAWKARAAIEAAFDIGLRVVINPAIDPTGPGTVNTYLVDKLGLSPETLDACVVNQQGTVPVGRATKRVSEYWYPIAPPRGGCRFAARTITVSPQGIL